MIIYVQYLLLRTFEQRSGGGNPCGRQGWKLEPLRPKQPVTPLFLRRLQFE